MIPSGSRWRRYRLTARPAQLVADPLASLSPRLKHGVGFLGEPVYMCGCPPAQRTGVNEVEQFAVHEPADTVTSTVTVYPGVALLMS